jgi:hypothetical protein
MTESADVSGHAKRRAERQRRDAVFIQVWNSSQTLDEVLDRATAAFAKHHIRGDLAYVSRIKALKWAKRLKLPRLAGWANNARRTSSKPDGT